MSILIINDLPEELVASIRRRAADTGVSVDEEIRRLLQSAYSLDQDSAREWARRQNDRLMRGELSSGEADPGMVGRINEDRERKLSALRAELQASLERGGHVSDEQLDEALASKSAELLKEGF
jgi:plasmid stability protein